MLEKYQHLFHKCFTFVKVPSNGRAREFYEVYLTDIYSLTRGRFIATWCIIYNYAVLKHWYTYRGCSKICRI